MYFITLNACVYILLLSSVITIIILLRKQYKQWKSTPLYILSMSDVLFSIFTSSILFMNCVEQISCTNYDKINNTYSIMDSMWNVVYDNEYQWITFGGFNKNLNTTINQNHFNVIQKCNIINIIVNYGKLFMPFVNTFVSLLIFSVQCNLNVFNFKNQCCKLSQSEERICEDNTSANKSNTGTQFNTVVNLLKSKKVSIIEQNVTKILQVFKCDKIKENKKITAIFVLSQWVVPIFITGLLYLIDYDKNSIKDMETTNCSTENIFFLDDCHNNIKYINISQNVDSETYAIPLYKEYSNDEDLMKLQDSNSTQVNEIISKVQNLVYSVMNNTANMPFEETIYNTSETVNITKYMELDTYTKVTEQSESIRNESNLIKNTNFQNNVQLSNYTGEDEESLLFNNLMMNSSEDALQEEERDNDEISTNTVKLDFKEVQRAVNKTQNITDDISNSVTKYNTSVISNDQIYAEIFKRIHNIPAYRMLQNYYKNKNHHNGKQPKGIKLKKNFQSNSTFDKERVLSDIEIIIYQNDTLKIIQVYIPNKYLMSIQLLKLHLLVLVFIIYFLPILFSSILQQRGKLNCQIILEQLKAKNKMQMNNFNFDFTNEINNASCNVSMDSKGLSTSKQDFKHLNENTQESIDFNTIQFMEIHQEDFTTSQDKYYENDQDCNISFDETKTQVDMMNQIENMLKLFDTIKTCLLCGILLWTPLFFEYLIKVFTSLHVPEWLLNTTYLAAITFSMLRNIFNLKMIKFQETDTMATKRNSIRPIP